MSTYTPKDVAHLFEELGKIEKKRDSITIRFMSLELSDVVARRFLLEGALRRVSLVAQCIHQVFDELPPEMEGIPEKRTLNSATIALHAASINTFGVLDCLAHVWAKEFKIQRDGKPLPDNQIGLGRKHRRLWKSLDKRFRELVIQRKIWIENIGEFRDALAHKLPPYIPPHMVDPSKADDYRELGKTWYDSLDPIERARLENEMEGLAHFKAFLVHDYKVAPPIAFHSQILVDFLTLEEFCNEFADAIRREKKKHLRQFKSPDPSRDDT